MNNSITINRTYIKENHLDLLNENLIELNKKELVPILYRVYKEN